MSAEENPPTNANNAEPNSANSNPTEGGHADQTPVEATVVNPEEGDQVHSQEVIETQEVTEASLADPISEAEKALLAPAGAAFGSAPPIAANMDNMAANGGAIGALVLGIWVIAGSFITSWSLINGLLGLIMGFWGLTSRKQRIAWIGISLCLIGIFMCLIEVNHLANQYFNAADEL